MPVYERASDAAELDSSIKHVRARLGPSHIALAPFLSTEPGSGYNDARLRSSLGKGREVAANATLGTGSQVLIEEPYAHEIGARWIGKICSYCFGDIPTVPCRQCNYHRYCSRACENNDWTRGYHSVLCSLYGVLNEDQILAIKAYLRSCASNSTKQLCFNNFANVQIPHLASNLADVPETDTQSYSSSAAFCAKALYLPASSVSCLVTIFAQIRCNRFAVKANTKSQSASIVTHVDETLGSAVYLQASMLNHSCQPNAFQQTKKSLSLTGHLLVAILDWIDNTNCKRNICFNANVRHVAKGCETDIIQRDVQICPSCGKAMDWEQIDTIEKQADQIKSGPCTLQQLKRVLKLQLAIYNPDALAIGSTYDNIAATYANTGDFATAATYCSQSLDIVRKQFGIESLESADELFKLATLLFNAMKPKEAYRSVLDCIALFRKLGLDKVRIDDMEELKGMRDALENSRGHWFTRTWKGAL
ncbi:hypothetical protein INT43_005068 [Umbelopsis isabellina]|uniref:MYND-type domain-containing protein n=1 Tax=Mortierella isabellina TaxID=91625 RepID=A0A8H7PH95_MORIS|nr:hypothetical protein INT43_005068 [Umbelopsis isabellina]